MLTRTPVCKSVLIEGAHLVDPAANIDSKQDIFIEKGIVSAVGKPGVFASKAKSSKSTVIEGRGLYLSPGLIDLNCAIHEPGHEHLESFTSGSRAAASGGFTTLLVMPASDPINDNAFMTDMILRRAIERSDVRVFCLGALTVGLEGKRLSEMGTMAAAGAVAFGDGRPVSDSYLMRKALEYSKAFQATVFAMPEDKALAGLGVMNEGVNSNRLGLRGCPAAAEEIAVARELILANHTKGRLHLQSISTKGAVELIRRARGDGIKFSAETSPAYFTLCCDSIVDYDTQLKVHPPLRTSEDTEAIVEALGDGTLDCIASQHRPQSRSSKDQAFEHASSGMISLETSFLLTLDLVSKKKIKLSRAIELLSSTPASILGRSGDLGTLKVGSKADFVLFDLKGQTEWTSASVQSASQNSPFVGKKLTGKIHSTYVGGTMVYSSKGGN